MSYTNVVLWNVDLNGAPNPESQTNADQDHGQDYKSQ